jgi:hypothetical protein
VNNGVWGDGGLLETWGDLVGVLALGGGCLGGGSGAGAEVGSRGRRWARNELVFAIFIFELGEVRVFVVVSVVVHRLQL